MRKVPTEMSFNVIQNNNTQGTFVAVREYLVDGSNLLRLRESHHAVGRYKLDERKVGRFCHCCS